MSRVGKACGRLDARETASTCNQAAAGLGASEHSLSLSLSATQLAELAAATQRVPPALTGFRIYLNQSQREVLEAQKVDRRVRFVGSAVFTAGVISAVPASLVGIDVSGGRHQSVYSRTGV